MARLTVSLLGDAFSQAFRNLGPFASTQGVFILASALVSLAASLYLVETSFAFATLAAEGAEAVDVLVAFLPLLAMSLLASVAAFLLSMLALGMGILVSDALQRGERPSFGQAWQRLSPRLGNLLVTSLLVFLAIMGILLAGAIGFILIVPLIAAFVVAVYLLLRWALAFVVSVLEDHPPTGNLRRSGELTKGAKGMIFVLFLLLFLVSAVPGWIVGSIVAPTPDVPDFTPGSDPQAFLDAVKPDPATVVLSWAVNTVFQLLGGFVTAALLTLVYHRLRTPEPTAAPPAPAPAGW